MKFSFFIIIATATLYCLFLLANYWTRNHPKKTSKNDAISIIENFLNNSEGPYDWDDFLTFPIEDPEVEALRLKCINIKWETKEGRQLLREELAKLKTLT